MLAVFLYTTEMRGQLERLYYLLFGYDAAKYKNSFELSILESA